MRVVSDGVALNVEVDGSDDGSPVVFLHGVSGSVRTFEWLGSHLADRHRVMRLDLRGHGRSEHAPGTYVVERFTLADTDTVSPLTAPAFLLAADEARGSAFPARHDERLAQTHPEVEVARIAGAGHSIHDEREHRPAYLECLAAFLGQHAPAAASAPR
jgi:pimeloyl-ACP methyl ester carboxylesterase